MQITGLPYLRSPCGFNESHFKNNRNTLCNNWVSADLPCQYFKQDMRTTLYLHSIYIALVTVSTAAENIYITQHRAVNGSAGRRACQCSSPQTWGWHQDLSTTDSKSIVLGGSLNVLTLGFGFWSSQCSSNWLIKMFNWLKPVSEEFSLLVAWQQAPSLMTWARSSELTWWMKRISPPQCPAYPCVWGYTAPILT